MAQSEVGQLIDKLGLTKNDIKKMAKYMLAEDEVLILADEVIGASADGLEKSKPEDQIIATRLRSVQVMLKNALDLVEAD